MMTTPTIDFGQQIKEILTKFGNGEYTLHYLQTLLSSFHERIRSYVQESETTLEDIVGDIVSSIPHEFRKDCVVEADGGNFYLTIYGVLVS